MYLCSLKQGKMMALNGNITAPLFKGLYNPLNNTVLLPFSNLRRRDKKAGDTPYDARLCHVVMGEDLALWNISWLNPDLTNGFPQSSIINQETLAKVTPIITFREIRAYEEFDF